MCLSGCFCYQSLQNYSSRLGCVFILTCGLHQLWVQAVGDQRIRQVSKESLQRSGNSIHRHIHRHKVNTVIYREREGEREKRGSTADSQGHSVSEACSVAFVSSSASQTGKQQNNSTHTQLLVNTFKLTVL